MENVLNDSHRLHKIGFAILWLYPKSKRPIGDKWTEGPRTSWDTLKKIYREPQNVGVRLGTPSQFADGSYLCVLDCDVKASDPHYLREMELALYNFAPSSDFAPRVLSGRGGGSCHLYFRTKDPQQSFKALRSSHKVKVHMPSVQPSNADRQALTDDELNQGLRLRLAWEIDVFGEGKQVVVPPSVHPDTGKAYAWDTHIEDYESIPLVQNFKPSTQRVQAKRANKEIKFKPVDLFSTPIKEEAFDLIVKGKGFDKFPSRSEALFSTLNALINAGLSDEEIFYVLTDEANFMSDKPLQSGGGDPVAAATWLSNQIAKIRGERSAEEAFKNIAIVDDLDEMLSTEEAEAQAEDLLPWQSHLSLTNSGMYKNTAQNLYLIFKHASPSPIWAYDEFNNALIYSGRAPWNTARDVGRELKDSDDVDVKVWLSREWGIEASTQAIAEIATKLALENTIHPVKRYLRSLKWDGTPRLSRWLIDYMGAVGDEDYISAVGRKVICAAVARVLDPGVKFDYMLILEGSQGIGKSSAVAIIAGDWFGDSLGDIESKDVVDVMRGKWIIEVGELASMDKATTNSMKLFISRTTDKVRKAYARRAEDYPRQCIFIGTTNDSQYLKDESGARRFWPVKVTKCDFRKLEEDRDQLIAEAVHIYEEEFEPLYLVDQALRDKAAEAAGERYVADAIEQDVSAAIENLHECFTLKTLWAAMRAISIGVSLSPDMGTQKRIGKALTVLGYIARRVEVRKGRKLSMWGPKESEAWVECARIEIEKEQAGLPTV